MPFSFRSFKSKKNKKSRGTGETASHQGPSDAGPSTAAPEVEQETYTLSRLDEESDDDREIPVQNVEMAALIMAALLSANNAEYAIIGGFSLRLRGSSRVTEDVDFGINLSPKALWEVITQAPQRLILPNSKLVAGVVRVFLRTGPSYGDNLEEDHEISVDLLFPGSLGWPTFGYIASAKEQISATIHGTQVSLWVLSVPYALRAKLASFADRGHEKDFHDILYLALKYQSEVASAAESLDRTQRIAVVNDDRISDEDLREQLARILRLTD